MQIIIADKNGNVLTQVEDFLSLEYEKKLNDGGGCVFALKYDDVHLTSEVLKIGNQVEVKYFAEGVSWKIFEGVLAGVKYSNTRVEFQCLDWAGYLDSRLLHEDKSFAGRTISTIVTWLYNHVDTYYPPGVSVGVNDLTDIVDINYKTGDSLLKTLQKLTKLKGEFRVVDKKLDYTTQTGETKTERLVYNHIDPSVSNIVKWEWTEDTKELANVIIENTGTSKVVTQDATSVANIGMWEKSVYTPSGATEMTPSESVKLPEIEIDPRRISWWELEVGDRMETEIKTPLSYLDLEYTGVVQNIKTEMEDGMLKVKVKIGEEYKADENIASELRKKLNEIQISI